MAVSDVFLALAAFIGGGLLGSFGWAAASGVLAGALDQAGIVIAASTWLSLSPVAGLLVGVYAVAEVTG